MRERMVEAAAQLLSRQGLQATSFSEVLEVTGAPRGSVYHHFPEGKDQLVAAAVDLAGTHLLDLIEKKAGASAEEVTEHFLLIWRTILSRSQMKSGCAVLAVTVATDSHALLNHAAAVFRGVRARLAALLEQGGLASGEAAQFAATLVASSEGAVVLSRAEQSMEPFELVAAQLRDQIRRMVTKP
ncbi:Transcriptional regulator, TetR family [Chondromyces apiculatus DSM 436]|uniref:Transcriptional regulator, TetR family n=1 Tax=Chondromyces apiculatus DSM 436 TaxID=1192034 RepID=A0A017T555_9BACT|nr:Transcriptional regulator, TetR family [Chondromyces apiculatus DSM 436]